MIYSQKNCAKYHFIRLDIFYQFTQPYFTAKQIRLVYKKEVPWVVNNNHFDVKISYTIVLVIHYFCEKTAKSSTYMYMHKILTISNIFKHNSSSKQDLYNFVDLPTQYSCPLERRTVSLSLHDVVQFLRT